MSYVLLDIGCAECRGWVEEEPLVEAVTYHASLDDAKAHVTQQGNTGKWYPHPLGGEFLPSGSGDLWAAPVETFTQETA